MSTSFTFRVSEKDPAKYFDHNQCENMDGQALKLLEKSRQYKVHHCTEVLQGSSFPPKACLSSNGFVNTVVDCYNKHHNLILRPDDIWTALMVQLSYHVNANAEEFRGKFVNFEGKKKLSVEVDGDLRSVSYATLVKLMSKEIDDNLVDKEVKSWVLPSFSTTKDDDLVTCGVVFMATMKKYFKYGIVLCCGIPEVTLEGTVCDWEDVSSRLEKLKEYDLGWWYDILVPILDQFIKARKGEPDIAFWGSICNQYGGGSGPTYLSGWITAFCVFDTDGKRLGTENVRGIKGPWPIVDMDNIASGSVEVDVTIDDNGTSYNSVLFAGHFAREIVDEGLTLRPITGWAICLKPSPEEVEAIDEAIEESPWR